MSSLFPFSLEELVALFFAGYLLAITGIAIRRRQKFMVWLRKTLVMVLWLFVWAYWGWGIIIIGPDFMSETGYSASPTTRIPSEDF